MEEEVDAVVDAAVAVEDVEVKKWSAMKKMIIHSVPIVVSFTGLEIFCHTLNPIMVRGPEFLKFYVIMLLGFSISVFCLKLFRENRSTVSLYFMLFIFILGVVKLIRGLSIDRPVGILISIIVAEIIVFMMFMSTDFKHKIKPKNTH